MALKYTEKVQICRQKELDEYKQQILDILEDSRQLVMDCDNLVKIRARLDIETEGNYQNKCYEGGKKEKLPRQQREVSLEKTIEKSIKLISEHFIIVLQRKY